MHITYEPLQDTFWFYNIEGQVLTWVLNFTNIYKIDLNP